MTKTRILLFGCVTAWLALVAYQTHSAWPAKSMPPVALPPLLTLATHKADVTLGRTDLSFQEHFADVQSRRQRILGAQEAFSSSYPTRVRKHLYLAAGGLLAPFALWVLFAAGKRLLVNRRTLAVATVTGGLPDAHPAPAPAPAHNQDWIDHAYPLQQITIRLQGTRHSSSESVVAQLETVIEKLKAGVTNGQAHDDDFGYSFEFVHNAQGPSFFDQPAGDAP